MSILFASSSRSSFYALFDAPGLRSHIIVIALCPLLGVMAVMFALILLGLALLNERMTGRLRARRVKRRAVIMLTGRRCATRMLSGDGHARA
jgi:ABC-type protease/lipase transport system fused ATPase/permease subunit